MIGDVMDRCRRHAPIVDAFFEERERVVLGIDRLRKRDSTFDQLFARSEKRVLADGVPPMFTLRPALRDLQTRGDSPTCVLRLTEAADRANAEIGAMLDQPDWVSPKSVGWIGAFAAAALVAHADDAPDTRRTTIERMRAGLGRGVVDPRRFAHIVDRDAAMHGRDQVYGTLFVPVDGTPQAVWPMPPERDIDEARRTIGPSPLRNDRTLYEEGAQPGPFLVPSTRRDAAVFGVRISASYLRHGRLTRRLFI